MATRRAVTGRGGAAMLAGSVVGLAALVAIAGGLGSRPPGGAAIDLSAPPRFVDAAAAAGLQHAYDGDFGYFTGGGVAAFDCSDDGLADLFLAGGENRAALYRNESGRGGELRFARVAAPATDLEAVTGAYPLDVDGDGRTDLAVLRRGENVLLRGLGDCRFERANEAWSFDGGDAWTAAFSATWEPSANGPTLAIGNYVEEAGPDNSRLCQDNELFRPGGSGRFAPPLPLSPGWCTLSLLFSDWDRSGRRDLRVSNDRHYYSDYGGGQEQLWRMPPNAAPRLYTADDGWQPLRIWGMGIASHDLTGDGYPEVFLTSQGDNKLQTLADGAGRPRYRDIALSRNATVHRPFAGDVDLPSTAWHAEFDDVNADGFIDLFVAKGNVEAMPDFAARDPSNLLLGRPDGSFAEAAEAAGIVSFARSRGAAVVDLNLDGLLDLVVVHRRENVGLWRNVGAGSAERPLPMGDWIAVRLDQPAPNRDAIGAWLEVRSGGRTTVREITVGGGHAGGQLGWVHVGLGRAERAEVRVTWPDGEVGPWQSVAANTFAVVERGAADVRPWPAQEE